MVAQHETAPLIPNVASDQTSAELEQAFYEQTENLTAGMMLYLAQKKEGQVDQALSTLRALEKNKNCPSYVFYLEAQLWAQKEQWELAWTAWWNFHST